MRSLAHPPLKKSLVHSLFTTILLARAGSSPWEWMDGVHIHLPVSPSSTTFPSICSTAPSCSCQALFPPHHRHQFPSPSETRMGSLLFSGLPLTPIGSLPRACNISCPAARDRQDKRGRRRARFSFSFMWPRTRLDDVIGVSLRLLFPLTSWTGQLSGWSGSPWQSICQDFLLGAPEMIAQRMSSGQ